MLEQTQTSTWQSKLKALGPGILMASAAVGGSHIVSSAQAGAKYGWALMGLVILANLFKYPFFRFGAEYTLETGHSLVEGYAQKGKIYLGIFFVLNVFSALVNTAGVGILCAAIIASAFPNALGLSITQWSLILIILIWAMLLFGGYKFLDGLAKWIMSALTFATVIAVIVAIIKHPEYGADFVEKTPWQMATLPFIVSLMGWMPAPIEISAINSLWTAEKGKSVNISITDGLFDFNVGYRYGHSGHLLCRYGRSHPVSNWSSSSRCWCCLHPAIRWDVRICSWRLVTDSDYFHRLSLYLWYGYYRYRWLFPCKC